MNTRDREDTLTLEILETIEQQNDVTQRHLADHLDIALGLANSYLKRCARKGLIKIQQAPANRYLYYLTPKGFAEKSRLTAKYLTVSFEFYRRAGESLNRVYRECKTRKLERIIFFGVSELAEIAALRAQEQDVLVVGTCDPNFGRSRFLGLPVWKKLGDAEAYDACLLTTLSETANSYRMLIDEIGQERVLVPSILKLSESGNE